MVSFRGGMSSKAKDDAQEEFISGKARIKIGQMAALAEGVDVLQDV